MQKSVLSREKTVIRDTINAKAVPVGFPVKWVCVDIPSIEYKHGWELQLALVEARRAGISSRDIILLLEHLPVFTVGRRGGRDHLLVSESFLQRQGIPLYHVERGGDITYHGPGQLVGYPIVNLRANGWRVVDFVEALEEIMIRTVGDWGIPAQRNPINRGVWVGMFKIGSVGIAVRRGISFHGFALNVNTYLKPLEWIHPCGLQETKMTSMWQLLGTEISMEAVRGAVGHHIGEIFGVQLEYVDLEYIDHYLGPDLGTQCQEAR